MNKEWTRNNFIRKEQVYVLQYAMYRNHMVLIVFLGSLNDFSNFKKSLINKSSFLRNISIIIIILYSWTVVNRKIIWMISRKMLTKNALELLRKMQENQNLVKDVLIKERAQLDKLKLILLFKSFTKNLSMLNIKF